MNIKTIRVLFVLGLISIVVTIGALMVWRIISQPKAERAFGDITFPKIQDIVSEETETEHFVRLQADPNLPALVEVYEKAGIISAEEISKALGFTQAPQEIMEQRLWTSGRKSLRLKLPTTRFTYIDGTEVQSGGVTEEGAIIEARKVILDLGLADSEERLVPREVERLLVIGGEGRVVSGDEPFNIYSVTFGYEIGTLSIINSSGSPELVNIWIGEDGTLKKIDGDRQVLGILKSSTYRFKSLDKAKGEIEKGEGSVVATSGPIGFNLKSIIQYNRAGLGYLMTDQESDYLQPVYIFKGFSQGREGQISVTTFLPAIE